MEKLYGRLKEDDQAWLREEERRIELPIVDMPAKKALMSSPASYRNVFVPISIVIEENGERVEEKFLWCLREVELTLPMQIEH